MTVSPPALSNRIRQMGVETAIYAGAQSAVRLLAMVMVALYARAITPEDFGLYDVVIAVFGGLTPLAALGLRAAIKRYWFEHPDPRAANTTALLVQVMMGLLVAVAGFLAAPALSQLLIGTPQHELVFRLALAALPFYLIQIHSAGMLRVIQRPWGYALIMVGTAAVQVSAGAWFVLGLGWGVPGIMAAQLLGLSIFALAGLWLARRTLVFRLAWSSLRGMLAYGVPLMPVELVRWATGSANRIIFALYGLLAAAGVYGVGVRAGLVTLVAAQAYELGWQPFALSITRREDAPRLYARAALGYAVLGGWVAGAVGLFARELVALLAPPEYAGALAVAPLAGLAYALSGLAVVCGIGALVTRQTWRISLPTVLGAAVTLALSVILLPVMGAVGAGWAMLAGQGVAFVSLVMLVQRVYPVPFAWGRMLVIGGGAVVLCLLGSWWPELSLPAALISKSAVLLLWPLALTTLSVIRREDWQTVRRLARRSSA